MKPDLKIHLKKSFEAMIEEINRGLSTDGVLCEDLKINCVAKNYTKKV